MEAIITCLIGIIFGIFFGFLIIGGCMNDNLKNDAVKAGAAEYYLDSNYLKCFRWNTNR